IGRATVVSARHGGAADATTVLGAPAQSPAGAMCGAPGPATPDCDALRTPPTADLPATLAAGATRRAPPTGRQNPASLAAPPAPAGACGADSPHDAAQGKSPKTASRNRRLMERLLMALRATRRALSRFLGRGTRRRAVAGRDVRHACLTRPAIASA